MSEITLVKTGMTLSDQQKDGLRTGLFSMLAGLSEEDGKMWKRFWNWVLKREPGELIKIEAIRPRNSRFHRKAFALLNLGFESWEPPRKRQKYKGMPVQKNFDRFREDVTIAAGFYEQTFDLDGNMKLRAKSISFSNMDEDEFERFYSAIADVLLQKVLASYAGRKELDSIVEKVCGFL